MDGAMARKVMESIKESTMEAFQNSAKDDKDQRVIDAIEEAYTLAIAALPPSDSQEINYICVACPATDMMPYEDFESIRMVDDQIDEILDEEEDKKLLEIPMSREEAMMVQKALTVYKSAMMVIHKDRMRDDFLKALQNMSVKD